MTPKGTVAIATRDDLVLLTVRLGPRPITLILPAPQARELSRMIRNAADFAEAAGRPQGRA